MQIENTTGVYDKLTLKQNLMQGIHHLLSSYKVDTVTLNNGLEKAFGEIYGNFDDLRLQFLGLTLWYIFAKDGLWIKFRTPTGNVVSENVLISAYVMWREAARFARKHGADSLMASSAMECAAHVTTDNLASGCFPGNIQRYMFGIYRKTLANMIRRSGRESYTAEFFENRMSDQGAFAAELENHLFAKELMALMPPRTRRLAYMCCYYGYSLQETAEIMGMSVRAVQKSLSIGSRKALDEYNRRTAACSAVRSKSRREKQP